MSTISKEAVCDLKIKEIISQNLHLKSMVSMAKSKYLNSFLNQIHPLKDQTILSPLDGLQNKADDIISELTDFESQIINSGSLSIQGDGDILEYLDTDFEDPGSEFNIQDIPGINTAKHIFGYIDNCYTLFSDYMDGSLTSAEKIIGESLFKLENIKSLILLDSLLETINSLSTCSDISLLPTHADIEESLAIISLDIQCVIDPSNFIITNLELSTPQLDQCLNIKDIIKSVSDKCDAVKISITIF